ncbi:MAG: MoaD/ThiS family protein [Desulfobacteraceae bacterium]|jgi:molybdopterin synthase sulfur carrier subunit
MEIKVKGFLTLRKAMDDQALVVVNMVEPTIRDVLEELSSRFGNNFRDLVFDPKTGKLRRSNTILVNGRHFRNLPDGVDSKLKEGDEVALFPPVAGG